MKFEEKGNWQHKNDKLDKVESFDLISSLH